MDPDDVPNDLKRAVYDYARQAATMLGLSPPIEIKWWWVAPEGHRWNAWVEFYGDLKYCENVINVAVKECKDFTPNELKWLIFHESRHLWQQITSRFIGSEAEKDAWEWASKASGCYNNSLKQADYWNY